jgi:ATP-dependent Lhr-like helicase
VARLQAQIEADDSIDASLARLTAEGIDAVAAAQVVDYLWATKLSLGSLPTTDRIILERFFDESGGMQLVLHAPFGSRINRAWGLALRKRFCRKFDFELQAAATEEAIILSLSTSHSFPLAEVIHYLHSSTVREVLVQALLTAPMFNARWRWSAGIALALPRFRGGRRTPPQLQRMYAEDLIADLFPDQIACAENLTGPREIPDHPLVQQAIRDCLEEAMDIDGLEVLLRRIEAGEVAVVAKDVTEPSLLAAQILAARPYVYLDDAPLEERRTQAVMSRRWLDPGDASDLGRLDPRAIARVREEAFPTARDEDELHDVLMWCGFLTTAECDTDPAWAGLLGSLAKQRRAARLGLDGQIVWVAAERLPRFAALLPTIAPQPPIGAPAPYAEEQPSPEAALLEIVRGRLQLLGPVTAAQVALPVAPAGAAVDAALLALEAEGFVLRGQFDDLLPANEQWCERGLLARIHRYTLNRLRAEIEPVTTQDFMRFLFSWQHVLPGERKSGPDALPVVLASLEGFEAPASAWESDLLPLRITDYQFTWLDDLCLAGRAGWLRLAAPAARAGGRAGPVRSTPIALVARRHRGIWQSAAGDAGQLPAMSSRAERVVEVLQQAGASFFDEIVDAARLLPTELESALAELAALGVVGSDSFAGIRALLLPSEKRKPFGGGTRRGRRAAFGIQDAGRWALVRAQPVADDEVAEHVARVLLRRYGVIFWRLLAREADWLPPWRDLLRVLRRLEARGEIRGGRFVAGVSGEQYALPEALAALRSIRRLPADDNLIAISAADPLNLVGVLLPGARVPALASNRILFRDGVALAALVGKEAVFYGEFSAAEQADLTQRLNRRVRSLVTVSPG